MPSVGWQRSALRQGLLTKQSSAERWELLEVWPRFSRREPPGDCGAPVAEVTADPQGGRSRAEVVPLVQRLHRDLQEVRELLGSQEWRQFREVRFRRVRTSCVFLVAHVSASSPLSSVVPLVGESAEGRRPLTTGSAGGGAQLTPATDVRRRARRGLRPAPRAPVESIEPHGWKA